MTCIGTTCRVKVSDVKFETSWLRLKSGVTATIFRTDMVAVAALGQGTAVDITDSVVNHRVSVYHAAKVIAQRLSVQGGGAVLHAIFASGLGTTLKLTESTVTCPEPLGQDASNPAVCLCSDATAEFIHSTIKAATLDIGVLMRRGSSAVMSHCVLTDLGSSLYINDRGCSIHLNQCQVDGTIRGFTSKLTRS